LNYFFVQVSKIPMEPTGSMGIRLYFLR